jgi:2-polyprenyl-6-methoxyphenol hydroxylase-like FAD-dependent oxidoreductase
MGGEVSGLDSWVVNHVELLVDCGSSLYVDAAHCHSPAGGQGMNLGLQDGMYSSCWE